MIIQIQGNVQYKITLDPSTWIFDDRKVTLEDALSNSDDNEQILFSDDTEWNRQIIEGSSKPPTLKSEKKFKKKELLEKTFIINLSPFLEYTEPDHGEDSMVTFTHDNGAALLPYKERESFYAQFSVDGKRLYDDNMIDLHVIKNGELIDSYQHVTGIKFN